MSTSVLANGWDEPVKPTMPVRAGFNGDWVTPVAGESYYIYNVVAAQFMGCGRDWGTRTITTNDSIVSPDGANVTHETSVNFALPYSISAIGEDGYLRFSPLKSDLSGFVTGLVDGNASWQDGADDRAANWQLVPAEDGAFLLHDARNAAYDPEAFVEDDPATEDVNEQSEAQKKFCLLGVDAIENGSYTWIDAWAGVDKTGKSYKTTWKFVAATDDVAKAIRAWRVESLAALDEAMALYNAAMAIYNAKVTLLATLNAADAAGISETDIESAAAIYQSESATEAEILAANTRLQLLIQLQSAELPADITSVLQNPDFEVPTANGVLPPGWDITITGQNCGQQNRTDTNADTGLSITNFIEAWHPSSLGNGVIAQTVYGLPAGVYRLECDASICHDPASGDGTDIVGAGLYIQAGVLRASTPIGTPRLGVSHFEVEFENDGGQAMTFGLFAENTNANWLSADNFKLYYVGQLTESPHYKNLKKYLEEILPAYSAEVTYCNAAAKKALNSAINVASGITTDASDAECDAAYSQLKGAYDAVTASVKVYQSLYEAIQTGGIYDSYVAQTSNNGWNDLSLAIANRKSELENGYYNGTFADEDVEEAVKGVLPMIRTWVSENIAAVQPGTDLTILLENADFEDGKYSAGWDAADDEVQPGKDYGTLPGWTISSGNITQMNHVIETYHRKFDFNQTIPNMPAGVYDITVQGFVRHDGDATDQTIFYAGNLETQLMLRSDQWNETGFYLTDEQGDPCGGANKDQDIIVNETTVKVPNGMSGFYYWEKEENTEGASMDYQGWQAGDKYYTNHIRVVLNEAGDLTIGMKSLGTTDWIIWDNFQIKYLGLNINGLYVGKNNQPIEAGESADIEIGLKNELTNLVAFQMDLTLPEGIGIDKTGCSLSSRITDAEQELTIGKLDNGAYRLTSSSFSLTPISGNLGKLITLKLTAADGCVGGKATIGNIRFSTAESERVTLDDASFDITVKYDIVYKVDNEDYKTESVAYGTEIIPPSVAKKEGYTFSGWSEVPETMPNHDVVVTGTFSINSYTLTYQLDGEVYKSTSVVYGAAITPEDALSKEGYTFSGWSEIPETMPARDVVVTGSFSVNSYNLIYKVDGEEYKTSSVAYGTKLTSEPAPSKEGYTFSGWSEIPETMPAKDVVVTGSFTIGSYTLTYKVDGEDYKTAIVVYGTPLTPEAEPTKEGYIFSGWSEIPETMPGKDVVISGYFYLYGDVNADTEVDVVDVVDIARYVVATPSAKFQVKLADLNADNTVNIADAVTLVSHIAGNQNFVKAKSPSRQSYNYDQCQLQLLSSGTNALSLSLNGDADFTAFQFEVTVPDNMDISAIRINGMRKDGHQLLFNKVSENCYRVVALSLSNATFKGREGELLQISVNDQPTDDICVNNIHFVTTNGTDITFDTLYISSNETGIANVNVNKDSNAIYDLQGRKLSKIQRGVNIVNGKKVVVKR